MTKQTDRKQSGLAIYCAVLLVLTFAAGLLFGWVSWRSRMDSAVHAATAPEHYRQLILDTQERCAQLEAQIAALEEVQP